MDSPLTEVFPHSQEVLLEFRAGKMLMDGNRVIPDTRKGLTRIRSGGEGLVHFQWIDRSLNIVKDVSKSYSLTKDKHRTKSSFPRKLFSKRCSYVVNQSSGRIFILKFHTDDRKSFFWMQEPKADNDTQLCSSVNFYLNQPLELPGEEEPDVSIPVQSAEDDISSSDVTSAGPVKLVDLQRLLSNIGSTDEAGDPDASLGLGDILKPELIYPLIQELPLDQQLASHLPKGQWTAEELLDLLQSPPFRQELDSFTHVLRIGQVDLCQFGIGPSKYKFVVPSFLEALEDSVPRISESEESSQVGSDIKSCHYNDSMDESQ